MACARRSWADRRAAGEEGFNVCAAALAAVDADLVRQAEAEYTTVLGSKGAGKGSVASGGMVCHSCGKTGHKASQCTVPRVAKARGLVRTLLCVLFIVSVSFRRAQESLEQRALGEKARPEQHASTVARPAT